MKMANTMVYATSMHLMAGVKYVLLAHEGCCVSKLCIAVGNGHAGKL